MNWDDYYDDYVARRCNKCHTMERDGTCLNVDCYENRDIKDKDITYTAWKALKTCELSYYKEVCDIQDYSEDSEEYKEEYNEA